MELQVFPLALAGGLQDSKPIPEPGDLIELQNFGIYRGRMGVRAPLFEFAALLDDQGTPQPVDRVLDVLEHDGKVWTVSWSSSQQDVYLHSVNKDGSSLTNEGVIWTANSTAPVVTTESVEGGDATSSVKRLYITDYNQNNVTRFWNGSTITTLSEDLNSDSTPADATFSIIVAYQFHMWGTGYFEEGAPSFRPEMLRFSQPGLIPGTDPGGGANPKEWFEFDHRSLGARGGKITAISFAGGRMVVFKAHEAHTIFGFDQTSWSREQLSRDVGAVGPHAVVSVDDRLCFFWSHNGPYMTDGMEVIYLGQPVQQRVAARLAATGGNAVVSYNPDDQTVHFHVGVNADHDLAFDVRHQRWTEGDFFADGGSILQVASSGRVAAAGGPGPTAAPTSLSVTVVDEDQTDLLWVNGDTAIDVVTRIHRDTSPFLTPGAGNLVGSVGSGATTFRDSGLAEKTPYYYKVRHERNVQFSANSNEDSGETLLNRPSGLVLDSLANGITVRVTNNSSAADLQIERRTQATGFALVHTIVAPGLGEDTWDDTTVSCGTLYFYRVRAVETGEPSSLYTSEANRLACS
jgi:hypothetical protein